MHLAAHQGSILFLATLATTDLNKYKSQPRIMARSRACQGKAPTRWLRRGRQSRKYEDLWKELDVSMFENIEGFAIRSCVWMERMSVDAKKER